MANMLQLILRGLQFFWTLLIMALTGDMIHQAVGGNPSLVNFDMVVAIFSMATLFYAIAVAFNDSFSGHPMIPAILDGFNVLFFFCSAVAMSADLGIGSCNDASYRDNNYITSGSYNNYQRCREAQAVTTFLWFNFALYVVTLILSLAGGSSGGVNMRGIGGIRRGPAMSHV